MTAQKTYQSVPARRAGSSFTTALAWGVIPSRPRTPSRLSGALAIPAPAAGDRAIARVIKQEGSGVPLGCSLEELPYPTDVTGPSLLTCRP